jgi:hypothetical protein
LTGSLAGTSPLPEPTPPNPIGAHSYDPGISANGLFWTIPIPEESVDVHLGAGAAVLDAKDIHLFDAFTVANSFMRNPVPVPAVIDSLRIEWSGITKTTQFSSAVPDEQFAGYFLENSATIEVTVTTPPSPGLHGFHFVSDATTASDFAQIGHDHNGSFFPG